MKKILFIIPFITLDNENGNDRFKYIYQNLKKDNDVTVITSSFCHTSKKQRAEVTNSLYKLIYEPGYKKNICLRRFYSHYVMARNLKKYLNTLKNIDTIYVSVPSLKVASVATTYAKKNKIKLIIDVQDLWPEAFKMVVNIPIISDLIFIPFTLLADYIYRNASDIVAVSNTYGKRALKVNRKVNSYHAIYLGTDINKFDDYKEKYKIKKDKDIINIVYIGTLGSSYNLKDTIYAIKELNDRGINNIRLNILGDGPQLEELILLVNKLKVNVKFYGRIPYNEMVGYLCSFDIAINPIVDKGAQSIINKVGDYAAASLPVVSTQKSFEYRKLMSAYKIGYYATNNSEDIADKLEVLVKDKNRRLILGKNNRKLAEEKFDRNKNYQEIIDLIRK